MVLLWCFLSLFTYLLLFGGIIVEVSLVPGELVNVVVVAPFEEVIAEVVAAVVVGAVLEVDGLNDGEMDGLVVRRVWEIVQGLDGTRRRDSDEKR